MLQIFVVLVLLYTQTKYFVLRLAISVTTSFNILLKLPTTMYIVKAILKVNANKVFNSKSVNLINIINFVPVDI